MKLFDFRLALITVVILFVCQLNAQTFKYETVPGDPLNVRIYTLANGLKVYMSIYKDEPRIQTSIAVKTGAKHDPNDNTGLSHYLEHLMFKGSEKFGTTDYIKESIYLQQIDSLFEVYRKLTDENKRKETYKIIDSISYRASQYAIPNEYDKMLSAIGAKGTNAYTSVEQTVYINDIPANQFSKWIDIEFDRFSKPVFRLFHTELETVYEEKNMAMDNDRRNLMETYMAAMYPTHPYGTQTTLGDPDHLKNPSILSLKQYYKSRYVPNNMAIILSGDFDPDFVMKEINRTFGKLPKVPLKDYNFPSEMPIEEPVIKEVFGPDAESLYFGFRFGGVKSDDTYKLIFVDNILSNRMAGIIDLNLVQAQKILSGGSFVYSKEDYATHMFYGTPKKGQSLEEVKDLLLSQLEYIKQGDFPDWYMEAIVNDYMLSELKEFESNRSRNNAMVTAFVQNIDWKDRVNRINEMKKLTKKDIIDFANKKYAENYVVVYKRTGEKQNVHKIDKPHITPVVINRELQSDFLKNLTSRKVNPISPVFLDYEKDVTKLRTKNNIDVLYAKNVENPTFSLYYLFEMGTNHDKKLGLALDYINYLGTSKFTAAELLMEFYRTGCSFNVSCSNEQIVISLSGLSENMEKGMTLLEMLFNDVQPNEEALNSLIDDILKKRADAKLSKNSILWSGMFNYGMFGQNNPFTNILTEAELRAIKPVELTALIKGLFSIQHKAIYYGSHEGNQLVQLIDKHHTLPKSLKPVPQETIFKELENTKPIVYVVNYDMKQVDLILLSKSVSYNPDFLPQVNVFNEYFGSGMSSIVFQELREAKGLAYTAYANFRTPSRPDRSHYIMSFIGTQNDKLPEATAGMADLINNMPESEKNFNTAKEAIIEKIRTERITKASILFNYLRAEKMGLKHDIRKDVYKKVPEMTFNDLRDFQRKYLKDKTFTLLVLGNIENLNLDELRKYGEIEFLELSDIFGY